MSSASDGTRRFLFTGDSITRGDLGRSYVDLIRQQYPDSDIVNLGQDGDTLRGIRRRTIRLLERDREFNLLIIAAGHNDVILPALSGLSTIHAAIPRQLALKGSVPIADPQEFLREYREFLDDVWRITRIPVIITTLSSVNEDPGSPTAETRRRFNDAIRTLTHETDADLSLVLADVGGAFDAALEGSEPRDYFMKSLIAPLTHDRWSSRSATRAEKLSSRRGLALTIDGVHINETGARLYAECITRAIDGILPPTGDHTPV
jgi:lysophospholipase L1-like esterase